MARVEASASGQDEFDSNDEALGPISGGVPGKPTACPAFFIGDDESDVDLSTSFLLGDDESDAESFHRHSRRLSLDLSTTASGSECHSLEDASKQQELCRLQWSTMRGLLSTYSNNMLRFQQELKSLSETVDHERHERLMALRHSEAMARELATCSARLAQCERLSREGRYASVTSLEATRTCVASIEELSYAAEKEVKDRVELEVSVHQALIKMQADFEQQVVQQNNSVQDLKHNLDEDLILFKEQVNDQGRLANQVKEVLETVDRDRQRQCQDFNQMRNELTELRADIDGACRRMEDESAILSEALVTEGKDREDGDEDIKNQLDELRIQIAKRLFSHTAVLSSPSSCPHQ